MKIDSQSMSHDSKSVLIKTDLSNQIIKTEMNSGKTVSVLCNLESTEIEKNSTRVDIVNDFRKYNLSNLPSIIPLDEDRNQTNFMLHPENFTENYGVSQENKIQNKNRIKTEFSDTETMNNNLILCKNAQSNENEKISDNFVSNISSISSLSNKAGRIILNNLLPSISPLSTVRLTRTLVNNVTNNIYALHNNDSRNNNDHCDHDNDHDRNILVNNNDERNNNNVNNCLYNDNNIDDSNIMNSALIERDEDDYSIIDNFYTENNFQNNVSSNINSPVNFENSSRKVSISEKEENFDREKEKENNLFIKKEIYSENGFEINFYREKKVCHNFTNLSAYGTRDIFDSEKSNIKRGETNNQINRGIYDNNEIQDNLKYLKTKNINQFLLSGDDKWKDGQIHGLSNAIIKSNRYKLILPSSATSSSSSSPSSTSSHSFLPSSSSSHQTSRSTPKISTTTSFSTFSSPNPLPLKSAGNVYDTHVKSPPQKPGNQKHEKEDDTGEDNDDTNYRKFGDNMSTNSFFSLPIPKMRILLMSVGTFGDVQPFATLGQKLLSDGHRVRLATHQCFRTYVQSMGLEFYPLAGDPHLLSDFMVKTNGFLIPTTTDLIREVKMIQNIFFQ